MLMENTTMSIYIFERRLHVLTRTLEEVWFEVDIKDVSTKTFYRVIKRQDVDPLSVLDVETLVYIDEVSELDP